MPEIVLPVDTAVVVPVNRFPLLDDGDFKTQETSVAYNAPGLALYWNFVSLTGAYSQTAVTPTNTGGVYDWTALSGAMYKIEIPASAGGTINNDTEGFGWFSGIATGVLSWIGPIIAFVPQHIIDSLYAGTDKLQVDTRELGGTSQTGRDIGASVLLSSGTSTGQLDFTSGVVKSNLAQVLATALTEGGSGRLAAAIKQFFDIASPTSTMDLITAATTVTNLTNAPTAGDFTSTMKTSLNNATPVATLADGAITAAKIDSNAIDADALATDAVAEITAAVLAGIVDGTIDLKTALKRLLAKEVNKALASGSGDKTIVFRNSDDTADVLTQVIDDGETGRTVSFA